MSKPTRAVALLSFASFFWLSLPAAAQDWFRAGTGLSAEKPRLAVADFVPRDFGEQIRHSVSEFIGEGRSNLSPDSLFFRSEKKPGSFISGAKFMNRRTCIYGLRIEF